MNSPRLLTVLALFVTFTSAQAAPEIIRTADFVTAAGLAAADVGLAIAPRSLSRLALDNLCFRDISDYAGQLDLVLALRADGVMRVVTVRRGPDEWRELALQFDARMFALTKQAQRPPGQ